MLPVFLTRLSCPCCCLPAASWTLPRGLARTQKNSQLSSLSVPHAGCLVKFRKAWDQVRTSSSIS
eukprot:scaffold273742_cov20-Tisochrysis_lutea.AAC.1